MIDHVRDLGWFRFIVAILLAIVCVVAAIGFAFASHARGTEYVALGLDSAIAAPDGTVRLRLHVGNASTAKIDGLIRVEAENPASAPGLQPIVADVSVPVGAEGSLDVELRRGCGIRLAVGFDADRVARSLIVFVPCVLSTPAPS